MRRFLTGDVHGIARMVKDFNVRAGAGVSLAQGAGLRAAVGN
jgi:3-deoxy-D-manno-octulosonate 8-phosphate phosphatase KdsC-like HAD superfamily phosphatase